MASIVPLISFKAGKCDLDVCLPPSAVRPHIVGAYTNDELDSRKAVQNYTFTGTWLHILIS